MFGVWLSCASIVHHSQHYKCKPWPSGACSASSIHIRMLISVSLMADLVYSLLCVALFQHHVITFVRHAAISPGGHNSKACWLVCAVYRLGTLAVGSATNLHRLKSPSAMSSHFVALVAFIFLHSILPRVPSMCILIATVVAHICDTTLCLTRCHQKWWPQDPLLALRSPCTLLVQISHCHQARLLDLKEWSINIGYQDVGAAFILPFFPSRIWWYRDNLSHVSLLCFGFSPQSIVITAVNPNLPCLLGFMAVAN